MKRELLNQNLILKMSFEFSLEVIEFCELLESRRKICNC